MFRIAVIDDDKSAVGIVSSAIKRIVEQYIKDYVVEGFTNVKEFDAIRKRQDYDLLFLDIDVAGDDGIDYADKLKAEKSEIQIIFVSNREDRVFDAFKVHPYGFIRKRRFFEDTSILTEKLFKKQIQDKDCLIFKCGAHSVSCGISSVIYIESFAYNQIVHCADGVEIKITETIKTLSERLKEYGFIQVHKSYLVMYRYIRSIESKGVVLTTGQTLPLSRKNSQEIKKQYLDLVLNNGAIIF